MNDSQRAWELAMVLIANGKIPFDPANLSVSINILSRHLEALEAALHDQTVVVSKPYTDIGGQARTSRECLIKLNSRKPSLACAD